MTMLMKNIFDRERNSSLNLQFQRRQQFTPTLIDGLDMCGELNGHDGCVNTLEWNETGELLASGSDDQKIIIWRPFRNQQLSKIVSGHNGNIFSLKWIPGSGSHQLASTAADGVIFVHNITSESTLFECRCHSSRVKRLEVTELEPYLIWSAGEDGLILQNDIRSRHECISTESDDAASHSTTENMLINLNSSFNYGLRAKSIALNRRRPEQLAIGCNDPFVRLYDRRMIRPICMETFSNFALKDNVPLNCAQFYKPGYQPWFRSQFSFYGCSFLTFSPDGRQLLANTTNHVYLYDVSSKSSPISTFDAKSAKDFYAYRYLQEFYDETSKKEAMKPAFKTSHLNGFQAQILPEKRRQTRTYGDPTYLRLLNKALYFHRSPIQQVYHFVDPLPHRLQKLKEFGNMYFQRGNYCDAIRVYNDLIGLLPNCVVVRVSRAISFFQRGWEGDYYQGFRDCLHALKFDFAYSKAHFWLAKSLLKLGEREHAQRCVRLFRRLFPEYPNIQPFNELEREIKDSISEYERGRQQRRPHENSEYNRAKLINDRVYDGKEKILESGWLLDSCADQSTDMIAEKLMAELRRFEERTRNRGITEENEQEFEQIVRRIVKAFPEQPNVMKERIWRLKAEDFSQRFTGQMNVNTDIKEANFLDSEGRYIVAGSDGGYIFIWDRQTTNILKVLKGDETIVNCVQPHQSSCFLATSGIDKVIRLWSPIFNPNRNRNQKMGLKYKKLNRLMSFNQTRLNVKCVEMFLMNAGYAFEDATSFREDSDSSQDDNGDEHEVEENRNNRNNVNDSDDDDGDDDDGDDDDDEEEEEEQEQEQGKMVIRNRKNPSTNTSHVANSESTDENSSTDSADAIAGRQSCNPS